MNEMGDMKFTTAGEMMRQPEMLMLIGVPGSGKSTWLKEQGVWDRTNVMVLSTDNFIDSIARGKGQTYSDVFHEYIKLAEKQLDMCLETAIEHDMDIIWDQTNLTQKSRAGKLRRIPSHYRKVARVFPVPDSKTHQEWLNSADRSGKVIPSVIVESMIKNFEAPTIYEGFDEVITPVRF